jgi:hypothetical protein
LGSVADIIQRLDDNIVDAVFKVVDRSKRTSMEFVILYRDKGYFCTCASLENKGIVCRHFFRLLQEEENVLYHVSAIPMRWFKEALQDDPETKNNIIGEFFVSAFTQGEGNNTHPPNTYMGRLQRLTPPQPTMSLQQQQKKAKKRYTLVMAAARKLATRCSTTTTTDEEFNTLLGTMETATDKEDRIEENQTNDVFNGIQHEDIRDGEGPSKRGRGKSSRKKSVLEAKKRKRTLAGSKRKIMESDDDGDGEDLSDDRKSVLEAKRRKLTLARNKRKNMESDDGSDGEDLSDDKKSVLEAKRRKLTLARNKRKNTESDDDSDGKDLSDDKESVLEAKRRKLTLARNTRKDTKSDDDSDGEDHSDQSISISAQPRPRTRSASSVPPRITKRARRPIPRRAVPRRAGQEKR